MRKNLTTERRVRPSLAVSLLHSIVLASFFQIIPFNYNYFIVSKLLIFFQIFMECFQIIFKDTYVFVIPLKNFSIRLNPANCVYRYSSKTFFFRREHNKKTFAKIQRNRRLQRWKCVNEERNLTIARGKPRSGST